MRKVFDLFDSEAGCSDDDGDEDEDNDQSSSGSLKNFIIDDDTSSVFSATSATNTHRQHPTRIVFSESEHEDYEYELDEQTMSPSEIEEHIQQSKKKTTTAGNKPLLYNIFNNKAKSKTKTHTKQPEKKIEHYSSKKANNNKTEHLPGFCQYPLTEWSLTVSKLGADVDISTLQLMYNFLEQHCSKGAISTEVGKRAHNLHLQGVFQTKYPKTDEFKKKLNKFLKQFLPSNSVGYRVVCKPLTSGQDFLSMIGYVLKDEGQAWFQTMTFNVTRYDHAFCIYYNFQ